MPVIYYSTRNHIYQSLAFVEPIIFGSKSKTEDYVKEESVESTCCLSDPWACTLRGPTWQRARVFLWINESIPMSSTAGKFWETVDTRVSKTRQAAVNLSEFISYLFFCDPQRKRVRRSHSAILIYILDWVRHSCTFLLCIIIQRLSCLYCSSSLKPCTLFPPPWV